MSDLNDDLLNYELGEDIDDQALLAGDEDELLLSDEEIDDQKAKLKDEAEKWVNSKLQTVKAPKTAGDVAVKVEDVVTTSSTYESELVAENVDTVAGAAAESDVSTSEESPIKQVPQEKPIVDTKVLLQITKNDEVTSTNKEIEEQTISQTPIEKCDDVHMLEDPKDEELVSQEFINPQDDGPSSDPREDFDEERGERTNIKLSAERDDQIEISPEKYQSGRYPAKRGRGGMAMRGGHFPGSRPPVRYPHINYPQYPHHPNENINPQMAGGGGGSQYPPPYGGHMDPQMGSRQPAPFPGCNSLPPRMEYRPLGPNFRPQNPNEFNVYRGPRPDYLNGAQYNNFGPPSMRPMYRPDGGNMPPMPPHMRPRMPMQRPPNIPPPGQGNFMPQQHPSMQGAGPQHPNSMNQIGAGAGHPSTSHNAQSSGQQSVLPRKVLINPNFKGGVEAATNQLMKDTQFIQAISSHVSHLQSDEELLRQQEEFINKNRIHIQKRRYERSPERNRSRERSYSPPRRGGDRRADSRERRAGSRGRNRRAGSREFDARNFPKRRRSGSFERRKEKEKIEEEEDEETRAYRMEIEKQKEMREKILRDKEMRRRKAAEGKLNEEKAAPEEPPSKLKPIIVTESKIISLKKKKAAAEQQQQQQQQQQQLILQKSKPIQRTIPTAKILPESVKKTADYSAKDAYQSHSGTTSSGSATLAVIKPVMKKPLKFQPELSKNNAIIDEDELLEEELLADTPSPPLSPKSLSPIGATFPDQSSAEGMFLASNRRVVLKQSKDPHHHQQQQQHHPAADKALANEQMKKGIFDRLEKKIGVNESAKRKIQRIVIKNAE